MHYLWLILLILLFLADVLHPLVLYTSKIARNAKAKHAITLGLEKTARLPAKASVAIDEYAIFRRQEKLFGGEETRRSTLSGRVSAGLIFVFLLPLIYIFIKLKKKVVDAYSVYSS